jgi:hypothetical protein
VVRELLDVVHQTKEHPLPVHFRPAAQREAIEPFVVAGLPNTGSTVPNRRAYRVRPSGRSMRRFIRAVCVSGRGAVFPRKNITERTAVVAGVSRHRARNTHEPQSRCFP